MARFTLKPQPNLDDYVWPSNGRMKPPPPRMGYAAKLAAHEAAQAADRCPDETKAGNPCKAQKTETGYCVGHSKARGLL